MSLGLALDSFPGRLSISTLDSVPLSGLQSSSFCTRRLYQVPLFMESCLQTSSSQATISSLDFGLVPWDTCRWPLGSTFPPLVIRKKNSIKRHFLFKNIGVFLSDLRHLAWARDAFFFNWSAVFPSLPWHAHAYSFFWYHKLRRTNMFLVIHVRHLEFTYMVAMQEHLDLWSPLVARGAHAPRLLCEPYFPLTNQKPGFRVMWSLSTNQMARIKTRPNSLCERTLLLL